MLCGREQEEEQKQEVRSGKLPWTPPSNPEYTGLLQNPKEEKHEMAASHMFKISLLHFLLNCRD